MRGSFALTKFAQFTLSAVAAILSCICLINVFDDARTRFKSFRHGGFNQQSTGPLAEPAAQISFAKDASGRVICTASGGTLAQTQHSALAGLRLCEELRITGCEFGQDSSMFLPSTNLKSIIISNCTLNASILSTVSKIENVRCLELMHCTIPANAFRSLSASSLSWLRLRECNSNSSRGSFEKSDFNCLGAIKSLRRLDLYRVNFADGALSELRRSNIVFLDCKHSYTTFEDAQNLLSMPKLQFLRFYGDQAISDLLLRNATSKQMLVETPQHGSVNYLTKEHFRRDLPSTLSDKFAG